MPKKMIPQEEIDAFHRRIGTPEDATDYERFEAGLKALVNLTPPPGGWPAYWKRDREERQAKRKAKKAKD